MVSLKEILILILVLYAFSDPKYACRIGENRQMINEFK